MSGGRRGRIVAWGLVAALAAAGCDGGGDDGVPGREVAEDTATVEVDTGDVLDDPGFRFCHEPGAARIEAAAWCDLLDELPPDRCEGLRTSCAEDRFRTGPVGGCAGGGGGGAPGGAAGAPDAPEPPPRQLDLPECGCDLSALGFLDVFLRVLVAMAVAGVVVLLLRAALGAARRRREDEAVGARLAAPEVEPAAIAGDDDLPDLPEEELLALAERALGEARLGEAVVLARGASLRRLARRRVLRLHRARTDREYLSTVRRGSPDDHAPLSTILGAVEDHRWAGRMLAPERASAAVAAARRLLQVGLAGMLLAWSAPAQAQSRYGVRGDAALHRLLEARGFAVQTAGTELTALAGAADTGQAREAAGPLPEVVVLDLSGVWPSTEEEEALRAWVADGGVLVVAGAAGALFDDLGTSRVWRAGAVRWTPVRGGDAPPGPDAGPLPLPRLPRGPEAVFCPEPYVGAWVVVDPSEAERVEEDPADTGPPGASTPVDPAPAPVVPPARPDGDTGAGTAGPSAPEDCRHAVVAVLPVGRGAVVALSDARVLSNGAMMARANQELLPALLRPGLGTPLPPLSPRPRTWVVTYRTLSEAAPPMQSMANARLLPFILQLMLFWLALAASRGWPFGPPRDDEHTARSDFGEHADAMGDHYARLGASRHAASAIARLWLERRGEAGLHTAALREGYSDAQARALVAAAVALADRPQGPDDPSDFETAEALWRITRRR